MLNGYHVFYFQQYHKVGLSSPNFMNGETEAWRCKSVVLDLDKVGYERMSSDVNTSPLTSLPCVCSCLLVPSVMSHRAPKKNGPSFLKFLPPSLLLLSLGFGHTL